ncbi:MAG: adenosylmethionine--8-amino-7-oxononanoate transaminase, partial [Pseudomonadota bacterium]
MVGIELAAVRGTRTGYLPDLRTGVRVCLDMRKRGVIVRPLGDVVVLMPPLSITENEIRSLVSATAASIVEICGN